MTPEEWLREFEYQNGREATPEEFEAVFGTQADQEEGSEEARALSEMTRRFHRMRWMARGLAVLCLCLIGVLGFQWWKSQEIAPQSVLEKLQGRWETTADFDRQQVKDWGVDYVRDVHTEVFISGKQVVANQDQTFDMKRMYEQSTLTDQMDFQTYKSRMKSVAREKSDGRDYLDPESGKLSAVYFEGTLDPEKQVIHLTYSTDDSYRKGTDLPYVFKDGQLVLKKLANNGADASLEKVQ